jgi:hypothetical protein
VRAAQRRMPPAPLPGSFEGITPIKLMISQVHEPRALAWVKRRKFDLVDELGAIVGRANFDAELAAELQALVELAEHRSRGLVLSRHDANALASLKAAAAAARAKLSIPEAQVV